MRGKSYFALIVFLTLSLTVYGQWSSFDVRPRMIVGEDYLHVETLSEEPLNIIINNDGTTMVANIIAFFDIVNYIDSTREIIISDFTICCVDLTDSISGRLVYDDVLYSDFYHTDLPEEISTHNRDLIFDKIKTTFDKEKEQWIITLPLNRDIQEIKDDIVLCKCGLRCLIKL